jgi:peroxin-5
MQKDPSLVEGWLLLGITLAENEQDKEAIKALKRCLELDSNSLEARMAIAVSYTNEGLSMQACKALEVSLHPSHV